MPNTNDLIFIHEQCGGRVVPIFFIEKEYKHNIPTGRKRRAVSHLECSDCGKSFIIDDSYDQPWY